jgi:copper chaperone
MAKQTLKAPAISCMHCVRTITRELSALPGVQDVKADAASKTVEVTYDTAETLERVKATLKEIGYPPVES